MQQYYLQTIRNIIKVMKLYECHHYDFLQSQIWSILIVELSENCAANLQATGLSPVLTRVCVICFTRQSLLNVMSRVLPVPLVNNSAEPKYHIARQAGNML